MRIIHHIVQLIHPSARMYTIKNCTVHIDFPADLSFDPSVPADGAGGPKAQAQGREAAMLRETAPGERGGHAVDAGTRSEFTPIVAHMHTCSPSSG